MTVTAGLVGEAHAIVDTAMLASAVGSGGLDVLSTPSMIALMEQSACAAIEADLPPGQTTVGTHVDVRHLAAAPIGARIRARAVLHEVDGRVLTFRIEAFDAHETIGAGTHQRAIVDPGRLLARAQAKR
ncbi:MAG: thioesterase family protein [Chloroflexi bacterium]|nr:thioesterase family protein [Chloroflexota bacterium]